MGFVGSAARKSWERRAAIRRVRLWGDQDRWGDNHLVRDLIAAIYGWFTQGLDTRARHDAKALLDQLVRQP